MAQSGSATKDKGGLSRYFRGVKAELKKVVWPTKKELFNYTLVVITLSILIAIIVYLLDTFVVFLLSKIIG